ncbi:hypothetical protein Nmel_013843, partial [Mimus melanotis]
MLRERAGLQLIPTSALSGSIRAGKNILSPVTHRDCGSRVGDLGCITHSFRGLELQGQMRDHHELVWEEHRVESARQGERLITCYCQHSTGNITNESINPLMHKDPSGAAARTCGSHFRDKQVRREWACPAWMHLGMSSVKGSFTDGPSANFSTNDVKNKVGFLVLFC